MNISKNNAGLAPLAVVLIIVAVVVVGGGGVYYATRNKTEVVLSPSPTPSVAPTISRTPTVTVTPTRSVTPAPSKSAMPKPTATKTPEVVAYATVQAAVNSGKHVICVSAWWSEKGPDQYRYRFDISGSTVIAYDDTKSASDEKITTTTTTYTTSSANHSSILSGNLSNATCTQQ